MRAVRRCLVAEALACLLMLALGCDSSGGDASLDASPSAAVDTATGGDVVAPDDVGGGDAVDTASVGDSELRVMTFNVLCSFCWRADMDDPWDERVHHFADIFARHDPDLIGVQEISFPGEVDGFLERSPGYSAVYYGGEDGWMGWPDATILYRTERFELRDWGVFWLSPTPDEPGSTGFAEGGQFVRLVVWAHLFDRQSGEELAFVTTHFDNNSPSQDRSAPLLLQRLAPLAESFPLVVTGDFNSNPDSVAYGLLTEGLDGVDLRLTDAFDLAAVHEDDTNREEPPEPFERDRRIDHFFLGGDAAEWSVLRWVADLHVYGPYDRYPSDHRALGITVVIPAR